MAMSPEERRKRDRERKARQRAANRAKPKLEALPQIGPGTTDSVADTSGTPAARFDHESDGPDFDVSNYAAALAMLGELTIPPSLKWRSALILRLALDLDSPLAVPQRAGLAARYSENIDALIAASRPRERDELDEMRRAFYGGATDGIDDDPEAPKRRTAGKKA